MLKDKAMGNSGHERRAADFYETPEWCVHSLLEHFDPSKGVWEPSCGANAIVDVLRKLGHYVFASDLNDYGVGAVLCDFLTFNKCPKGTKDIVGNPPYGDDAEAFIRHAIKLVTPVGGRVAFLLRNEYDCAKKRRDLFDERSCFATKVVLTTRPRWIAGTKGSPRHNYSWFIWDTSKEAQGLSPEILYS